MLFGEKFPDIYVFDLGGGLDASRLALGNEIRHRLFVADDIFLKLLFH